jgi:hypothetical protein
MQLIINGEMKSSQLLHYEKKFIKNIYAYEKAKVSCYFLIFLI